MRTMLDLDLRLQIAQDHVGGYSHVNKFGRTNNVDSAAITDIWDGAVSQIIWLAPTAARIHQLTSTDAGDDGDPAGLGAQIVRIWGLKTWASAESSEDIILNGTGDVPTVNSYVIIHRMQVIAWGATSINIGVITATADTDSTVTAQINAVMGQTLMSIYGIPSTKTGYMTGFYIDMLRAQAPTEQNIDFNLVANIAPDVETTGYTTKHAGGLSSFGSNPFQHLYNPYKQFIGPTIIKIQAIGSAADLDVSAGFDLIIADNT